MSRIDRALAGNPLSVSEFQCQLAAQSLNSFSPKNTVNPWSQAPTDAQIAFKLFFVSICHQINWDFLQRRLFERFFSTDYKVMLDVAMSIKAAQIEEILDGYHRPERIKSAERARYLRDTAVSLQNHHQGNPTKLVESGRIFGDDGLFERLKTIHAFSEDPLSKKSNALAQELAREGIASFEDADSIPPAIDYHLIRLYLRTGRVVASNKLISEEFIKGETHRPRLIKLLREAVSDALSLTAKLASMPVHQLNYLEWQVARNRCEVDYTICDGDWPLDLLDESIRMLSVGCPLKESCVAYKSPEWKKMRELTSKKAFY